MAITLYDELGGTKNTGGTWSQITTTGPAAPGTYNGSIDLAGYPGGVYTYRYTVTSGGETTNSDLNINWNSSSTVYNDDCTGATLIATHTLTKSGETEITGLSISNNSTCSVVGNSTLDGSISNPTEWGATATSDNWYKVLLPQGNASSFNVIVSVTSEDYGEDGADDLMLALYSGTCAAETLLNAEGPVSFGQLLSAIGTIGASNTETYLLIRVAIPASTSGSFDMLIQTNI